MGRLGSACLAAVALAALAAASAGAAEDAGAGAGAGTEKPPSPFGVPEPAERPDAVPGKAVLSDGGELRGRLYLTRDAKLELFVDACSEWRKLDLQDLKTLAFSVEKEEVVREWRWKEAGSDEKVETGRTRVDRKYSCRAVLRDGTVLEGHVRGTVIYMRGDGKDGEERKLFLRWNQPGGFEQKPADLVYVKELVFGAEAARGAEAPAAPQGDEP